MYEGSMVGAGMNVFAVMGYVIAKQRPKPGESSFGELYVELNARYIAAVLGATPEEVLQAIAYLCGPDPESRTEGERGARLVREGSFLYRVVNGRRYRTMHTQYVRREQNRRNQQAFRERRAAQAQVAAESQSREQRFVAADKNGNQAEADRVAAEGLERYEEPGSRLAQPAEES
jgi:hypothetical protein